MAQSALYAFLPLHAAAQNGRGQPYDPYSLTFADTVTQTRGNHYLKMGGEIRAIRMQTDRLGGTTYTFANVTAFLNNQPSAVQYLGDESEPSGQLRDALARDFGSYERWRSEFLATGKALRGGSGWVLLTWSPRDGKLVNQWASDHCHTLAGATPILALDMYEHSYHIDFGARADTYVEIFMQTIRWENAERLFKQLEG